MTKNTLAMIKVGNKLRHRNCLDMDMVIVKVVDVNDIAVCLEVAYFNRKDELMHNELEMVSVKLNEFNKWSVVKAQ